MRVELAGTKLKALGGVGGGALLEVLTKSDSLECKGEAGERLYGGSAEGGEREGEGGETVEVLPSGLSLGKGEERKTMKAAQGQEYGYRLCYGHGRLGASVGASVGAYVGASVQTTK